MNAATIQFRLYFSRWLHSFIIILWYFCLSPIQLKNVKRHNNAVKFKTTTTTEWKISRITAHPNSIVFVQVQSLVGYRGVLSFHRSSIALMQTLVFENGFRSHSLRPPILLCLVLCLNHKGHIKTRPFCNINENEEQRARFITNSNWLIIISHIEWSTFRSTHVLFKWHKNMLIKKFKQKINKNNIHNFFKNTF